MIYLIILGVIILAVGFSAKKTNSPVTQYGGMIKIIGFAIIII